MYLYGLGSPTPFRSRAYLQVAVKPMRRTFNRSTGLRTHEHPDPPELVPESANIALAEMRPSTALTDFAFSVLA